VSMWGNGEKVLSETWIPLVAFCFARAVRSERPWSPSLAWASVALALVAVAGDPFLWLQALGLAVPIAFVVARETRQTARAVRVTLSRMAQMLGIASLTAAPVLWPAWLSRGQTVRGHDFAAAVAEAWSLHPARLLELVAPGALGDPLDLGHYPGVVFAD